MASAQEQLVPQQYNGSFTIGANWDVINASSTHLSNITTSGTATGWKSATAGDEGFLFDFAFVKAFTSVHYIYYELTAGGSVGSTTSEIRVTLQDTSDGNSAQDVRTHRYAVPSNPAKSTSINSGVIKDLNSSTLDENFVTDDLRFKIEAYSPDTLGLGNGNEMKIYQFEFFVVGKTSDAPHIPSVGTYTAGANLKAIKGKNEIIKGKLKVDK
tara:strand:- start:228 stop:866 length:639 start_codon:yes stop_codon:yes gene_type:complete